jgi:hypothetical protein
MTENSLARMIAGWRRWTGLGLLAVPIVITVVVGINSSAGSQTTPSPPAAQYLPSISDIMIATIQPRHERVLRAEKNGNWEFAAYELSNLHGAFERLGHAHPTTQNLSLTDMIASTTEAPFNELKTAIQAKDDGAFTKAYGGLTEACNSCHQALNHGVVSIAIPEGASLSDLKAINPARP